jgi:cystathionine gamma-synthase
MTLDPATEAVYYPGLDPTTRTLAERQMPKGCGPLLSFQVRGDAAAADRVVGASHIIRPAPSFGGVESTWERRARWTSETAPDNLIRLSVGLEALEDLIADLTDALAVLR